MLYIKFAQKLQQILLRLIKNMQLICLPELVKQFNQLSFRVELDKDIGKKNGVLRSTFFSNFFQSFHLTLTPSLVSRSPEG